MNADQLSICPKCGSDACYKLPINETAFSYWCFGCGAHTTDLQKLGEVDLEQFESTLPELYKDVRFVDEEARIWYPITINIATKGTVFLNGKSSNALDWCAIRVRELTEEERNQAINKDLTHKSDSSTMKLFGNDFIEALDYINFFEYEN